MRKVFRRTIATFLVLIIALGSMNLALAAPAARSLRITATKQGNTSWCWAACAEMVGKYERSASTLTQKNAVIFIHGSNVNKGGTAKEAARAVNYIANYNVTYSATGKVSKP